MAIMISGRKRNENENGMNEEDEIIMKWRIMNNNDQYGRNESKMNKEWKNKICRW